MKTSEVLSHAKHYLAPTYDEMYNYTTREGKEKFICIAVITAAAHSKRITDADVKRCAAMVESRLEGESTLESWLQAKGCLPHVWMMVTRADRDRIQQHRHAWLDQMIEEFKAKGD